MGSAITAEAKPRRAVAVVLRDGQVLVILRRKAGRAYAVLPGGGIEAGEDPSQACARELLEETGLILTSLRLEAELLNEGRVEYYFAAQAAGEELRLGGPEGQRSSPQDVYTPAWVDLTRLDNLNLQPEAARAIVRRAAAR